MLHHAIIGGSGCGKTTLAKKLAGGLLVRGIWVAVLDPFRDDWPASYQTHHPDVFLAYLKTILGQQAALFIDESSHALDRFDPRFDFLSTGARHCGFTSYFIAQRWTQLSPNIRGSVTTWWIFNNPDGVALAKRFNQPKLQLCSDLQEGQFYLVQAFKPLQRGTIKGFGTKKISVDLKAA